MNDPFLHKKFIFNEKIDRQYLFSLYEDDLSYIEEIFKTTLDQLNTVFIELPGTFKAGEKETIRKIIHKIKPAFGFTGFIGTEKACKEFEDDCLNETSNDSLAENYHSLWSILKDTLIRMQKQYDQLKEFNSHGT
jgi:hypothetical protein